MGSRFRNELTVVPPVRIRVTRQGLSTTINWNAGGTARLASSAGRGLGHVGNYALSGPLPTDRYLIPGTRREYGGGNVADMTSRGLDSFKALLEATRQRELEIKSDMRKARREVASAWVGRALGWASLTSVLLPSVRKKASTALATKRLGVATLSDNLAATKISVNFDMDTEIADPHRRLQAALDGLSTAQCVWTVQTEQQINRVKARSFAGTVVGRARAHMMRQSHSLVDTDDAPYAVAVQGGKSTAYFYPGFVLVAGSVHGEFALIDLCELNVTYESVSFTETEFVPSDARQVRTTWAKANKNGSRDRRFAHNRELPILAYGGLHLTSPGGLSEKLMISRAEASAELAAAIADLKRVLMSARTGLRIRKQDVIESPSGQLLK